MAALMTFGKRPGTHAAGPGSLEALTDPARVAARAGLRYLADEAPGFRRVRCGTGFTFRTPDGATLDRDGEHRVRVDALVIPPAWEDVWVCPDPLGHLQATGRDAAGRKQYLYHPDWHAAAGKAKWLRVAAFGRALPRLRRRIRKDGRRRKYDKLKVSALAAAILDATAVRVGSPEYAEDHGTHGLTTLTRDHVTDQPAGRSSWRSSASTASTAEARLARRTWARRAKALLRKAGGDPFLQYRGARRGVAPAFGAERLRVPPRRRRRPFHRQGFSQLARLPRGPGDGDEGGPGRERSQGDEARRGGRRRGVPRQHPGGLPRVLRPPRRHRFHRPAGPETRPRPRPPPQRTPLAAVVGGGPAGRRRPAIRSGVIRQPEAQAEGAASAARASHLEPLGSRLGLPISPLEQHRPSALPHRPPPRPNPAPPPSTPPAAAARATAPARPTRPAPLPTRPPPRPPAAPPPTPPAGRGARATPPPAVRVRRREQQVVPERVVREDHAPHAPPVQLGGGPHRRPGGEAPRAGGHAGRQPPRRG